MGSNSLQMEIRLLSPKVNAEGLTPHGLLNSFGPLPSLPSLMVGFCVRQDEIHGCRSAGSALDGPLV